MRPTKLKHACVHVRPYVTPNLHCCFFLFNSNIEQILAAKGESAHKLRVGDSTAIELFDS